MIAARRRRGEPLVALLLVLGSWIGLRAASWDASALTPPGGPALIHDLALPSSAGDGPRARARLRRAASVPAPPALPAAAFYSPWPGQAMPATVIYNVGDQAPAARFAALASGRGLANGARGFARRAPAASSGGWFDYDLTPGGAAGFAGETAPGTRDARLAAAASGGFPGGNAAPGASPPATAGPARRWSGDAWALLRGDAPGPLANGAAPASYGASQAGAVLRYGFAPRSGYRPAIYARVSTALGQVREYEGALGVQARPLPSVPVIVAGELRAAHGVGGTLLRPAGFAYTQLPRFALPLDTRGEAYLQGGYVGGAGATPFVDGQLRIDHALGVYRRALVRVGAGVWGGAQQGASRLDLGPGATLDLALRRTISARVAVDWRLRVAGDARPGSGPALTLSAGF